MNIRHTENINIDWITFIHILHRVSSRNRIEELISGPRLV